MIVYFCYSFKSLMKKNLFQSMSLMAPVLLLSACSGTKEKATETKPLNIIHIMTDDHSFQTISAYGHALGKLAPTPNIDSFVPTSFCRKLVVNTQPGLSDDRIIQSSERTAAVRKRH